MERICIINWCSSARQSILYLPSVALDWAASYNLIDLVLVLKHKQWFFIFYFCVARIIKRTCNSVGPISVFAFEMIAIKFNRRMITLLSNGEEPYPNLVFGSFIEDHLRLSRVNSILKFLIYKLWIVHCRVFFFFKISKFQFKFLSCFKLSRSP